MKGDLAHTALGVWWVDLKRRRLPECEAPAGHALPSINQVTLSPVYVLALEVEHVDSEERLSEFPHISLLFSVYRGPSLKG